MLLGQRRLVKQTRSDRSPQAAPLTMLQYQKAYAELEREIDTWKQLIQLAPIGFLHIDEDNQLIGCNSQACSLLNIQLSHPQRRRLLLELVRSYELDALIEQTRQTQTHCQREWIFYPSATDLPSISQQQPCHLRGYASPLPEDRVAVFLENRQEAVLLAQQRDRWISDVAHELKTPLTSIRLVAETLQPRLPEPTRGWVDRLLQETVRLSNLVQDLLDMNQLEMRSTPALTLTTVDLPRMIHTAWLSLEPLASKKHLHFDYSGLDRCLLQADAPRLHRVFLNLLDNAIKYSPEHEAIQVQVSLQPSTSTTPPQVQVDVIDSGEGFPEMDLLHVFDRFYRADPSRARLSYERETGDYAKQTLTTQMDTPQSTLLSNGTGLGLAIVRQIVEAHHGTVKAANHPKTGGGWLRVWLPFDHGAIDLPHHLS
jgi:two-component system phosphate regulon sensor histidine kinase PhoR